jgi:hypothetical protein
VYPRLEAVNLVHFRKDDDPGHPTNLGLHSRNVAGEARGIRSILVKADGGIVVGHAPTGLVCLDVVASSPLTLASRLGFACHRSLIGA